MSIQHPIGLSSVAWHELDPKCALATSKIESVVSSLRLSDYGNGLESFFFVHIIVQPTNIIHKNRKRYEKKTKYLGISWKVDYDKFLAADNQEALRLMAQTYLDCIAQFPLWKIPDFDATRFYQDVRKTFVENGVL